MKNAVVYGSGKIGRGFIGKIFAESGYKVCFLDRIQALLERYQKEQADSGFRFA